MKLKPRRYNLTPKLLFGRVTQNKVVKFDPNIHKELIFLPKFIRFFEAKFGLRF
jgi:hypothetical protein